VQLLNKAVVTEHLNMQAAIDVIEALLHQQAAHPSWTKSPERLVIKTFTDSDSHRSGSHLSMPATMYDGKNEYTVVKLVTICPDNPSRDMPTTTAIITVSNNDNGAILAVMDGIYITQVRTAALSGIATKYMAKPDCQSVAVVGCGGMAYEQLHAVLTVRPEIKTVYLWNRHTEGAQQFKTRFSRDYAQWNVDIKVCEVLNDAICNADIINVATRATDGLFNVHQIKSEVHINAVGAYQPSMKEISNDVIANSKMVIVDDLVGSHHEAGDLIQAHESEDCTWVWSDLSGDLQALVTASLEEGSTNEEGNTKDDKAITLFKSVGAASFDAVVSLHVAKQAQEQNLGSLVDW